MIHMKCQVLFSQKNNKNYFIMSSAANLPSVLRVDDKAAGPADFID